MIEWATFINALGGSEKSGGFKFLCQELHEPAHVSEDPSEYNDPVGKTKYFKFFQSGVEVGFREGGLTHIHFYFEKEGEYMPFKGTLLSVISVHSGEETIRKKLGEPSREGGGKMDMLLGYINRWIKYDKENYSLHLQFNQQDKLCKATLMK